MENTKFKIYNLKANASDNESFFFIIAENLFPEMGYTFSKIKFINSCVCNQFFNYLLFFRSFNLSLIKSIRFQAIRDVF